MSVNEKMTAIADAIRDKTGGTEELSLDKMAENIPKVYDAGKQAELKRFWSKVPEDGNMMYMFAGFAWNNENFNPQHNLRPYIAHAMFSRCQVTNLKAILERNNVVLDFSNCVNLNGMFETSRITHTPVIDTRSCSNFRNFLYGAEELVSVDKVILKDDGTQTVSSLGFNYAKKLTHCPFEGVIGTAGWDFSHCPLDKESITSICTALSTETNELVVTFSLTAVKNAFETLQGAQDGNTSEEWLALVATRTNWTFNLIDV